MSKADASAVAVPLPLDKEPTGRNKSFIPYIHYCRAFAMVIIVAGHCISLFDWTDEPRLADLLMDLVGNGTVLFVFLSGFLFEHLSGNYSYGSYLRKKLLYVWLPYLIISIPAIVYSVLIVDPATLYPWLADSGIFYQVIWFYREGGAHVDFPLWFIPVISMYYLAAPVFMLLIRHPRLGQVVLVPLIVLSLLLHRESGPNLATYWHAAYFLSVYVLGILASQNKERLERALLSAWPVLLLLFLAFVTAEYWFSPYHGNYEGDAPFSQEHGLIDWLFLQKILLCFVMLGVVLRYENHLTKARYFGDISFTVFLVHGYAISVGEQTLVPKLAGNFSSWAIWCAVVLACSVAFAYAGKMILGRYSRYIIGS